MSDDNGWIPSWGTDSYIDAQEEYERLGDLLNAPDVALTPRQRHRIMTRRHALQVFLWSYDT